MKDDFLLGFTFASIMYFFIHFFLLDSYTIIPLKKIVLACNENGYFIHESEVIICKSSHIIKKIR